MLNSYRRVLEQRQEAAGSETRKRVWRSASQRSATACLEIGIGLSNKVTDRDFGFVAVGLNAA